MTGRFEYDATVKEYLTVALEAAWGLGSEYLESKFPASVKREIWA